MHPLGHITVACGIVWAGTELIALSRPRLADEPTSEQRKLTHAVDYRLVATGALLPDIVDRPIGNILFRSYFDANDHLFGHTLLFGLSLALLGLILLRIRAEARLLCVAVASLTHLAVDPVAHAPQTLFWPALGTGFPQVTLLGLWATIATELASAAIIGSVILRLKDQGQLSALLRQGIMPRYRRAA